jgi:molecular chaperone GrpE
MDQDTPTPTPIPAEAAAPAASPDDPAPAGADDAAATEALKLYEEERDKRIRLAAEFDNFRKRAARERLEAERRGQGDVVKGLAESLDDLRRFALLDPAVTDVRTVIEGVQMVEKKVLKTLAGHGLELIEPEGRPFDPAEHEALGLVEAPSPDFDGTVAQVYQVGYRFHGQLLRPARVVVQQWSGSPPQG